MPSRTWIAVLLLTGLAHGQVDRVFAVSSTPTGPAGQRAVLSQVDLFSTGVVTLPRFPSDGLVPLAIAVEEAIEDVVLALQDNASSRIVRLRVVNTTVIGEDIIATIPGRVTALVIDIDGTIYATVDTGQEGLWRIDRRGPNAQRILNIAAPVALSLLGWDRAWLTTDTRATAPAQVASTQLVEFASGATSGLVTMPAWPGSSIVGHEIAIVGPTTYHIYVDTLGQVFVRSGPFAPTGGALTPPLPGTTRAMHRGLNGFAILGDQTAPLLVENGTLGGNPTGWTPLAGPFPGDPIDFAMHRRFTRGNIAFIGASCGSSRPQGVLAYAGPQPFAIGNAAFEFQVWYMPPMAPAVLLLGADDRSALGVPLPATISPGCDLLVSPDVIIADMTDQNGFVQVLAPIPADPALRNALFFHQWLAAGNPVAVSAASGIRLAQ